ncbi:hypothetical protein TI04_06425 [Achromatium sp. WMS2]|nr:hypothetical protein TI04_06425 [Achromatium sp. WMS2]
MRSLLLKYIAYIIIIWLYLTSSVLVAVPAVETTGEDGIISIASFQQLLANYPQYFYWLDVRDTEEIAYDGTYATAHAIPFEKLAQHIPQLPADKPIIIFCHNGARASEAYDRIKVARPEITAYFLDAHVQFQHQPLPIVAIPY